MFQRFGSALKPLEKNSFSWERSQRAPGRVESVTELMLFMNFLVHSYTCCSDRHASPYWTFIRRWISMDFTPSLFKKRMTGSVVLWCMLQAGPPSLHYYCAVVLHSCVVLSPVGHSSNHEYHCFQLTRQSSCVSNFYRTFKVFIWLSLVYTNFSGMSDAFITTTQHIGGRFLRNFRQVAPNHAPSHTVITFIVTNGFKYFFLKDNKLFYRA